MVVHNIASNESFKEYVAKDEVLVVDMFATWCGPCKAIAPTLVKFSEAYPSANFVKVDVDELPDVAQEHGVSAMPTFLVFKGGEQVGKVVGANPKALENAIKEASKTE